MEETGIFGDRILRDISNNICTGNTLVSTDIDIDPTEILDVKPLDIQQEFSSVFENRGVFHILLAILLMLKQSILKTLIQTFTHIYQGSMNRLKRKADLAILFIEKSLSLINNTGKIGFVIQKDGLKPIMERKSGIL